MRQKADGLAQTLSRYRKTTPRALVLCHNQSLQSKCNLRDILCSTHAILFFGTPHSGVEDVTLLEEINRLASLNMQTTNIILKDLRSHSSELENLQKLYLAASEKITSIFFCAEYQTSPSVKRQRLLVPQHSATIDGDRNGMPIHLHADHQNMIRFPSAENENYKAVLYYLEAFMKEACSTVQEKWVIEDRHRDAPKGDSSSSEVILPKRRPPVSRNYIKRAEIQDLITQKLLPGPSFRLQPRCILHGMGGAGKTQLATKWIEEHKKSFTRIIVVDASSQAELEADLQRSIRSVGPEYAKMTWEDSVAYLDRKEKGWLLFFDNADLLDLNLYPYLPNSSHGTILITTRNRECTVHAPDGAILVSSLKEHEAVELLHQVAGMSPVSNKQSIDIVTELGMLALAVAQAGAYIRKTRRLDTYLGTFREHRDSLMRDQPVQTADYESSIYAAFDLSFHQLSSKAQDFIKLCSFLHHSLIPAALFEYSSRSKFTAAIVLDCFPPPESDSVLISGLEKILGEIWDGFAFQKSIDSASQASFIQVSSDGICYTLHPLLQTYIKDSLDEKEHDHYARMTAQLLLGAIQSTEGDTELLWQLYPHIRGIPTHIQSENIAHALAFHAFYNFMNDWEPCRELLESALSQVQSSQNQIERIQLIDRLANIEFKCGQLADAEKRQREVLSFYCKVHGPCHVDTISALSSLATTLHQQNRLDEAEQMDRQVLDLRPKILGQCHPETMSAMSNLAIILCERGNLEEAEKMHRQVLNLRLETLEQCDLCTVAAMSNLATTLCERGNLEEAEKMHRKVLELRLEILGQRHPGTISAMSDLATTLFKRGHLEEAEKMDRQVLGLRLEILGQRNMSTVSAMSVDTRTREVRGKTSL
ncbi:related to kinesin light chain [Serendipita indica DSM 11827]|uniref:Related to kinesin light chain n=1 Tax=Serendipita indica (strain DSM 11827) TaxID=1109443 RepID=G4TS74_SERID|nr:related to kinesin light chain [Serendipita indica DSM 11827]